MTAGQPTPESSADLIRRFDACAFARLLGIETVGVADGCVRVTMRIAGMENAYGTTHGGAIFALADQAFGIAGNLDGVDRIATSAYIRYLSLPATDVLEAVARKVSETQGTSVYTVDVFSGDRLIASFEGIGFRIGITPERR